MDASTGPLRIYNVASNNWQFAFLTASDVAAQDWELHEPAAFIKLNEIERAWSEVFGKLTDASNEKMHLKNSKQFVQLCHKLGIQTEVVKYVPTNKT